MTTAPPAITSVLTRQRSGCINGASTASLEDLASANGVERTYVGRFLRLTSLAPEIAERILDGDEPEGISLAKLRTDLPVVWDEQVWEE